MMRESNNSQETINNDNLYLIINDDTQRFNEDYQYFLCKYICCFNVVIIYIILSVIVIVAIIIYFLQITLKLL